MEATMILQQNIDDEELIAATLLHDILEDTELEEEDLREIFNDRIADLVLGASEKLKDRDNKPWKIRKQHTIDYLKTADTEVQYIACADKLMSLPLDFGQEKTMLF
ncbi:HD domain-containing protein [Fuchsiella alkaliacetigena]|uniref:HD domain-containing protein n=1 Tax=Fuchsiella alkaliacetigena TaxID=957042 RepID=UPI00200A7439|nr:HD domain-containing protein [Fuchsiella alkaliacetigena]MCK8826072.1 HD domain-containing protein [Fuchsiella alkaliacetigena]